MNSLLNMASKNLKMNELPQASACGQKNKIKIGFSQTITE